MAIYNAKRIVNFSFVVIVSGLVISFLWADKILYGSEILFLKSRDFQWVFFTILFWNLSVIVRALQPPSPHLNARRYFGRTLSRRQFEYFRHGNIVVGFRFHVNLEDELVFYSLNFVFMFPCHAHCGCLTESWVWLLIVPTPFIPF